MMYFVRLVWEGIRYNKARAFLTGFGVFVGMGALALILVLTSSFFQGMNGGGKDRFEVMLTSSAEADLDVVAALQDPGVARRRDALRMRADVARVITPESTRAVDVRVVGGEAITGLGVAFADDVPLTRGVGFAAAGGNVAIAYDNPDYASGLSLGSRFTIDGLQFTVIGLTGSLGEAGTTRLYLPARLVGTVSTPPRSEGAGFTVVVSPSADVATVRVAVVDALNEGLDPRLRFVDSSADEAKALAEAAQSVGLVLGIVASISLAVAALNIVTVMYIATLERADEIAIYRSMGMTKAGVRGLFLVESTLIVALFALAGWLAGNLGAVAALVLLNLPLVFPWAGLLTLLGVIVLIGVGGGLYPASRAAAIDPVRLMG